MAKKGSFSKVYDKNGDYADVEAVRFDGTRTFQMQGDVTATQTWNGDSNTPLTLNASIGAKKVTQDKIGDKAVGSGQMADGSVGLTQMAASAMTDTVSANNNKLVTSQGVNAAIAAATLNRGKDYGPLSVDEINAISETIPTGSTVYVESLGASDAKVINDGYSDGTMASFSVEVGEDLKYYRSPDNSLHGWYSTEANVKIKQPANYAGGIAVDSAQDASSGSAGIEFIQSFKQNTNGDIRDIVKAQVDIVDSTSSTRTNAAATPNSVKSAYDLANTATTGLANKLDKTGDGKDVTATFTEASARANIGTGEKLSVMFGKIKKWFTDLGTAAFKNVPASGNASSTEVVLGSDTRLSAGASAIQGVKVNNTTLTPDANKVVTVPLATTSADGAMSAADKTKLNGIAEGAEANVQSDWDEADTSSDAFIKNKPLYNLYSSSASYKVIASVSDTTTTSGVSWSFMYSTRFHNASAFGVVQGHGDIRCSYIKTAGNATSTLNFYTAPDPNTEGRTLIIAYLPGYTRFQTTSFVRKDEVDFSVFGNNPPEGTTYTDSNLVKAETIAQSKGSSGTAPVKVDESGELTPVPMDSTPTESSTNLMTSGDIKTALDGKQDSLPTSGTAIDTYAINIDGEARSFKKALAGRNGSTTPQYAKLFTIDDYNTVAASSGVLISFSTRDQSDTNICGLIRINFQGQTAKGYVTVLSNGANPPSTSRNKFGAVLNASDKWEVWCSMETWSIISAQIISDSVSYNAHTNSTSADAPTGLTLFSDGVNITKPLTTSATGSTSVPIYAKADGTIEACTDDFVHDGDVAQTYSSTSEAPISGKGVAAAINSKVVAFADATYRRTDSSTDGEWFKIASLHPAGNFRDALASFDLFYGQLATEIFKVNVRIDIRLNGNGTVPTLSSFVTERTSRGDYGLRVVTRGTVGNCDIELWVCLPKSNISMALKMVAGSDLVNSDWKLSKDKTWTFYSSSNGGTSIPVEDASSNVYVYETTESKLLYSIPATGIPKTALASSVQTSLGLADSSVQNIAYVANQSGGGGNLNKTKNGTTTSVLTFMNDTEAVAIWNDAKTAAANAS